ncbi:hypothetical protein SUGI_0294410 [Cryptomeria japonica]|uniref:amino acid permease 2 n=1 Tax=Cryptomeria japonica TaxID=3369 RepID=UPI002408CDCE|nr:amino acid permease 2 [Cryptomeria japonica]XP_057841500.2 amino acid permease 2 [Cryptomeria japonica]XP_057841501.2 amino acid permease 2 [Cryptomeria japonica]GLJ17017.1 hypothetical protein SUGI_0294410 [Cryptomeria japonica]
MDVEDSQYGRMHEAISSDDGHARSGNVWTAASHVITAVIGAGVLSLPWSVAQLGWIMGAIILLAFGAVTTYTSLLLADCYRSPDRVNGKRNYKYSNAVKNILGGRNVILCKIAQYANLCGALVGYTLTSAISMMAIKKAGCFHKEGHATSCRVSGNMFIIIFGALELILSLLPSLEKISWLSIIAAIMSFAYSSIGLALSISKAAGKKHPSGSLTGVPIGGRVTKAQKTWYVFQALGNIALSYTFAMVLIEIQDTIKSPPPENKIMKKAIMMGMTVTTLFYMSIGLVGYAAFGNDAPGNMLTGFGFYEPFWLIDIGNLCIVIHLVGAYQVFSQPVFAIIEEWASHKWKRHGLVHTVHSIRIPFCGSISFTIFSLLVRSLVVVSTTVLAMLLPFFNALMGFIGAVSFWPLTVYLPIQMYLTQTNVQKWSSKWVLNQSLSLICFLITVAGIVGAIAGISQDLRHVTIFDMKY